MKFRKVSIRFFYPIVDMILPLFPELISDLKKAGMVISAQEFLSQGFFLTILIFTITLPLLSVVFAYILKSFLFGFLSSITACFIILSIFFIIYVNYPKMVIYQKSKKIDNQISFATLHLSTLASTKLPLDKVFEIFSKFGEYGEISKEISKINNNIKMFGLDINTALEKAVERCPSKSLKEILWGILSMNISGGDVDTFLREKSRSLMSEYRMKLRDFSHQLGIYLEIYITAIILGAVFFLILTSIVAGISGAAGNEQILFIQFFLIFVFLPLVSGIFIYLIRISTPGGE
jgi:flagellar protein FlaJ